MEYLDVLDAEGNPTGRKLKDDVHRDGDLHRAVHVWIINDQEKLLIQMRSKQKPAYPGKWDISSAGQVDAGEDGLTAALRETNEELGLSLHKEDLEHLFTIRERELLNGGTYVNNEFQDVYFVTLRAATLELHFQDKEVTAVRWISFRELEKLINARDPNFVPHDNEYKKLFEILHKRFD